MIKETGFYVHAKFLNSAKEDSIHFNGKTSINSPTGDFFYDPWTIREEYKGTIWETILNTLEVSQGEARIIVLKPGESYMAHSDIDDRYHLNIIGNNSFLIDILKQKMYATISDGFWYEMDAGRIHSATNYGEIPRAQLVVRKLLKRGKLYDPIHVSISPAGKSYDYRYQFDNHISPWLNQMNKEKKMNNFIFRADKVEFDIEKSSIEDLANFNKNLFSIAYE